MNIFIIPSWYPTERNPVAGIFIKEQAEALSELYPEHNFIISNAGDYCLSIMDFNKTIQVVKSYMKENAFVNEIKSNLFEFYSPALTWTIKLGGGENNLINAHTQNMQKAINKFGKIDIIHAHVSYPAGFAAMHLKVKFNIPFVITEHMGPFPFDFFLKKGILSGKISQPLHNADKIIAVSNYLAGKLRSFGFMDSVVIPNMVNVNIFSPHDRKTNNKKVRFLTVTSFIESKGIEELLNGILNELIHSPECEFIIAGSGSLENFIHEFINKNRLSENVKLLINPARELIVKLFQECDVFLLASRLESFGIVYIEAMSCGKPVIATDCGGPSDFVKDFNGKLIPVNNTGAISEAIKFFSRNYSEFSSADIREFIVKRYSQQTVCMEIISLYKQVLNNGY